MIIAGADGCKAGWLCITKNLNTGEINAHVYHSAVELISQEPQPKVIAVDIPIGLADAGPRECDKAARAYLREPRRRSVFPAPIRPALGAETREHASEITHNADGRRVGVQSWAIVSKIRDMDRAILSQSKFKPEVREVHPEVSFAAWNNHHPMSYSKKTLEGRRERRALVDKIYGPSAYDEIRNLFLVREVAHDDILDAFAALWTAERIYKGIAGTLPVHPPIDSMGLTMEIVY